MSSLKTSISLSVNYDKLTDGITPGSLTERKIEIIKLATSGAKSGWLTSTSEHTNRRMLFGSPFYKLGC
jgi:hypothetical protein